MNLALFDLDNTLLPLDSDYEWGQFLSRIGAVDREAFAQRNARFLLQYQNGTLNPVEYLEFAFGTLARFPRWQLDEWHTQFMSEVINPALRQEARALLQQHQDSGDLIAIITATNRFVTAPIAQAFGVTHLIAAEPELAAGGEITGRLLGTPPFGSGKVVNTDAMMAALKSGKPAALFIAIHKTIFHCCRRSRTRLPPILMLSSPRMLRPKAGPY